MLIRYLNKFKGSDNISKSFLTIKKKVNEILVKYDNVNYLENPSVDILAIAKENSIEIIFVPPEKINYKHAVLDDSNKDNVKILVNQDDSKEEQLFSIAHEIEHYLSKKAAMLRKADIFKNSETSIKTTDVFEKTDMFKKSVELNDLAARSGGNYKEAVRILKKINGSNDIARYIAEIVSWNLGKRVTIKKAYIELAKIVVHKYDSIRNKSIEPFLFEIINNVYNEEMADYFAANILVPTERFILWKNKSNRIIAKKFNVPEACISKRRKEIKNELKFITSKYSLYGNKVR